MVGSNVKLERVRSVQNAETCSGHLPTRAYSKNNVPGGIDSSQYTPEINYVKFHSSATELRAFKVNTRSSDKRC